MMRKSLYRLFPVPAIFLAACGGYGGGAEREPQTIRDLERQEAPQERDIRVEESQAVEANPELALENYRELLELSGDETTRAEAQRRMADLQLMMEDTDPDAQSDRRVREAIALYRNLLDQRPNDPGNDRVRYQLARALQNVGEIDAAITTLRDLIEKHPDSPYAADGRFRRAELLFSSRRHAEAAEEYEAVISLAGQTPFFEVSQYKYAWTLYNLGRHEDALEVIFSILDRELPDGEPHEPAATLAEVPQVSCSVHAPRPRRTHAHQHQHTNMRARIHTHDRPLRQHGSVQSPAGGVLVRACVLACDVHACVPACFTVRVHALLQPRCVRAPATTRDARGCSGSLNQILSSHSEVEETI